jgi:hypothetical protein
MDFELNYRELGEIGTGELASIREAVRGAPASEWDSEIRQRYYQAHQHTSSIILCFGPDDDLGAADFTPLWPRWEPLLGALLERTTRAHFGEGGRLIRLMLVRLYARRRVAPHTDDLPVLHATHRVHIPLITNPGVVFVAGDQVVPMREGQIVEINNQREHYVINAGKTDRVHLIFDFATADALSDRRGERIIEDDR